MIQGVTGAPAHQLTRQDLKAVGSLAGEAKDEKLNGLFSGGRNDDQLGECPMFFGENANSSGVLQCGGHQISLHPFKKGKV